MTTPRRRQFAIPDDCAPVDSLTGYATWLANQQRTGPIREPVVEDRTRSLRLAVP